MAIVCDFNQNLESECNTTSVITYLTALLSRIPFLMQDLTRKQVEIFGAHVSKICIDVRSIALAKGDHRAYYGFEIDEMMVPRPNTRSAAVEALEGVVVGLTVVAQLYPLCGPS